MSSGYIKSLDGLRAIAILLVMTFHFGMNHFGWIGVQLFFVLSGYLISGILWKEKFKVSTKSEKFIRFWARRSLRIFPLYFLFLIVLGISYMAVNFPSYYTTYIPYLATYTVNFTRTFSWWQNTPLFTHLWSLSVEEQFYLFFPVIIFLLPPGAIKKIMLAFIIAAPVVRFALGEYYLSKGYTPEVVADAVYWNTLSHVDAFFIGGLIPVFSVPEKITKPGWLLALSFMLVVMAGGFSFLLSNSGHFYTDLGYGHGKIANYEHVWHYTLLNFLFGSFILYLTYLTTKKYSWLKIFLESEWLVRIGRVSYGMYIFHWAILYYFFQKIFDTSGFWLQIPLFILYSGIVYLISELSYRLFEIRFINLKDRFFSSAKVKKTV